MFQRDLKSMALFLERLVGRRRLFTVYLWGKPLASNECEGNSGRGQNSPVGKPLEKTSLGALEQKKESHALHHTFVEL
jgi:hypothetical protein